MKSFSKSPSKCFFLVAQDNNFLQTPNKEDSKKNTKREKRSFVNRIHEHVKLGPKFSETVKGKLSLGVKVIQEGWRRNIFRNVFGMQEEKMLKASQCYLYTIAGPIAGILFILTIKVVFCSERNICFSSADGESVKAPYKVVMLVLILVFVGVHSGLASFRDSGEKLIGERAYRVLFAGTSLPLALTMIHLVESMKIYNQSISLMMTSIKKPYQALIGRSNPVLVKC